MPSCARCVHFDMCPIAHPFSGEFNLLIGKFFGRSQEEIANKCLNFLDVDLLDQEKIKQKRLELLEEDIQEITR